jgi:hypothetical protein
VFTAIIMTTTPLLVLLMLLPCFCVGVMVPGAGQPHEDNRSPRPEATLGPSLLHVDARPKLDELIAKLKQLKSPSPVAHETLEHVDVKKPTEDVSECTSLFVCCDSLFCCKDKHLAPEKRLEHIVDVIKAFQAQHLVLGAAMHNVQEKLRLENDQVFAITIL